MADVQEINRLDELADFRTAWQGLLRDTPRISFFHTLEWLETYWRHFGHDQKLRVLIHREQGRVVGIVPLCIRRERYHVGTVNVLTYPLDNWGMWYGPIGPDPAQRLALTWEHIHDTPRDWDLVDLRWSDVDACKSALFTPHEYQATSVIDLAGGWGHFLESKPKKVRTEIRRILRRFNGLPDFQYVRYRPRPDSDEDRRGQELIDMCTRIAARSWQAHVTDGNTLSHAEVTPFLQAANRVAARLGMVDINLLLVDDQPAAFLYDYIYEGRLNCLRTGFDPKFGIGGLGTALFLMAIRDSFERQDREIDLGPGEQRFKQQWRTRRETSYRLLHYPPLSLPSQTVRLSQWIKGRWSGESTPHLASR